MTSAAHSLGVKNNQKELRTYQKVAYHMFTGSAIGEFLYCFVVYRSEHIWTSWTEEGSSGTYYGSYKERSDVHSFRNDLSSFFKFYFAIVWSVSIFLKKIFESSHKFFHEMCCRCYHNLGLFCPESCFSLV